MGTSGRSAVPWYLRLSLTHMVLKPRFQGESMEVEADTRRKHCSSADKLRKTIDYMLQKLKNLVRNCSEVKEQCLVAKIQQQNQPKSEGLKQKTRSRCSQKLVQNPQNLARSGEIGPRRTWNRGSATGMQRN
ncbi:haloacid dehalogenase-like hydrolase superfamily protein [Striga asiatica]|uniref:Haloacid dehalogenase-like hydrolase superfamily protein n=1 Tax=Striga asiatica TaxID=4170 RepID=A0A5A7QS74_STRAF|nr:haloacid dehalogenase-like hydrolase superfamily protein [Striga asiatica]